MFAKTGHAYQTLSKLLIRKSFYPMKLGMASISAIQEKNVCLYFIATSILVLISFYLAQYYVVNGLNTGIIIEDEKCEVCNKDENQDSLLVCHGRAFHTYCLNPPHSSVPELDWDSFEIVAAVGKDYDFKDGKEYNLKDFQAVCDDFKTNHFKKTHPEGSSTVTEDECERKFWKLVGDPNETCQVEYGVDLHGR